MSKIIVEDHTASEEGEPVTVTLSLTRRGAERLRSLANLGIPLTSVQERMDALVTHWVCAMITEEERALMDFRTGGDDE